MATREQWLQDLKERIITVVLAPKKIVVPPEVQLSVGFPSVRALSLSGNRVIGQCFTLQQGGGTNQIFVSPLLGDPMLVAGTLVHELIHAADDCKSGHKGAFKKMALEVGLEGPMRATKVGEDLKKIILPMLKQVGPYPHVAITPKMKEKKPGTRMAHFKCEKCDYPVWTTWKWVEDGAPVCPCGEEMSLESEVGE